MEGYYPEGKIKEVDLTDFNEWLAWMDSEEEIYTVQNQAKLSDNEEEVQK